MPMVFKIFFPVKSIDLAFLQAVETFKGLCYYVYCVFVLCKLRIVVVFLNAYVIIWI